MQPAVARAEIRGKTPETRSVMASVAQNAGFRRLWLSQFISLIAVYGLNFAAVVQVENATHSSARTGLVILLAITPAFLTSLVAGVAVDRRDRVRVLVATHLARMPVALAFWLAVRWLPPGPGLAALLAINAALAALSQFAMPAELALLPDLVGVEGLVSANSLLQLSTLAAEGAGIVLLGPLLCWLAGLETIGLLGAGLYLLAAWLVLRLPGGRIESRQENRPPLSALTADVRDGWRTIAQDPFLRWITIQVTLVAALLLVLLTLMPGLATRVLGLEADVAVFLLLPGGVGFALGALLVSRGESRFSRQGWINAGLFSLGGALALVVAFSFGRGWLALAALAGSIFPAGVALAMVIVPARAVLQERPPAEMRGRVIAAQLTLGNGLAVLPLPLGGGLADIIGVRKVVLLITLLVLGAAVFGVRKTIDE